MCLPGPFSSPTSNLLSTPAGACGAGDTATGSPQGPGGEQPHRESPGDGGLPHIWDILPICLFSEMGVTAPGGGLAVLSSPPTGST